MGAWALLGLDILAIPEGAAVVIEEIFSAVGEVEVDGDKLSNKAW